MLRHSLDKQEHIQRTSREAEGLIPTSYVYLEGVQVFGCKKSLSGARERGRTSLKEIKAKLNKYKDIPSLWIGRFHIVKKATS